MKKQNFHSPLWTFSYLFFGLTAWLTSPCAFAAIERVSQDSSGLELNAQSINPSLSTDGRFVVFVSAATNAIADDTNSLTDIFLKDRLMGTTKRISVASDGSQADGTSNATTKSICENGSYIVFMSDADNLVTGDTNGVTDIFLHDVGSGDTTIIAPPGFPGIQANGPSANPSISADCNYVVFESSASNLVPSDTNRARDVFLYDVRSKTIKRLSTDWGGNEGTYDSYQADISNDGSEVVFTSLADNLVPGDTNGYSDVFLKDVFSGTITQVSRSSLGVLGNAASDRPAMNGTGSTVAFASLANNLVPGDTNKTRDVFLWDRTTHSTNRVSVNTNGVEGNGASGSTSVAINLGGNFVAFDSVASNLSSTDSSGKRNLFIHDQWFGITQIISAPSDKVAASGVSSHVSFSPEGRWIGFDSIASNLIPLDTNKVSDSFVMTLNWFPIAQFQVNDRAHTASWHPMARTFDASASYDPDGILVDYAWDFGDGETGHGVTPTHLYTKEGNFVVRLTVTDNLGAQGTISSTIFVPLVLVVKPPDGF